MIHTIKPHLHNMTRCMLLALLSVTLIGCYDPGLDSPISAGGSTQDEDEDETLYDADITGWMDDKLSSYYLYNEEYNAMARDTDLAYDSFLDATLMTMQSNTLDKKSYTVAGHSYTSLYTYITRYSAATKQMTRSSKSSVGYGFASIELFTLNSGATASKWINVLGVHSGSAAARAGITRGAAITTINGTSINHLTDQSIEAALLNPSLGTSLTISTYLNDVSGTSYKLTAEATTTSPILKCEIFNEGDKRIGYLNYTTFDNTFESELMSAVAGLKSGQITDLILDLRMNGGGYVSTANLLSTMIGGASASGERFSHYRYNENKTLNYGVTEIESGTKFDPSTSLFYDTFNSSLSSTYKLDLEAGSTIYCIVTDSTASASEMVINSLRGIGFEVALIGDTNSRNNATQGKNAGMFVFTRNASAYSYDFAPICFEIYNGAGDGEYQDGMAFSHAVNEYNSNYHVTDFTTSEPLIAKAISLITGATRSSNGAGDSATGSSATEGVPSGSSRHKYNLSNNHVEGAIIVVDMK